MAYEYDRDRTGRRRRIVPDGAAGGHRARRGPGHAVRAEGGRRGAQAVVRAGDATALDRARHDSPGVGEDRSQASHQASEKIGQASDKVSQIVDRGREAYDRAKTASTTCTIAPRRRWYDRADGDEKVANVALGAAALGAAYLHRAHAAAAADGDWSRDDGADGRASRRGWRARRSMRGRRVARARDMMTA